MKEDSYLLLEGGGKIYVRELWLYFITKLPLIKYQ